MGKVAARDLQKEAAWRRRLGRQARSGQSVRAWCRVHGVTETAFYWWRKELARRDREDRAASFVPVSAITQTGSSALLVIGLVPPTVPFPRVLHSA
jgi:hypothetical protein